MSMHYDSESLVDRGRSPRLFALLVIEESVCKVNIFSKKIIISKHLRMLFVEDLLLLIKIW